MSESSSKLEWKAFGPTRGSKAHVSVITALVMGPVTAHIAGKLAPHCGAFLGGTFTPKTSINSPAAMRRRRTDIEI